MKRSRAVAVLVLFASLALVAVAVRAQETDVEWFVEERSDVALWHWQSHARADLLVDHAQGAYDLVSDLLDVEVADKLVVVVWPTGADPADATQLPAGLDADEVRLDVTTNTSGDVRNAITNALINTATGQYAGNVPIWMRSALGFWSHGPLPGFFLQRAGSVVIFDHEEFYTIEQLETVPSTWQFQAKYFGQAGGMLAWFIQDWGPEALAELMRTVGEGTEFYDAVEQVYGIPEERLIAEFTKNAERSLLLLWPFIKKQSPPFYERLNINHILIIAVCIPGAILLFFISKRLFWD